MKQNTNTSSQGDEKDINITKDSGEKKSINKKKLIIITGSVFGVFIISFVIWIVAVFGFGKTVFGYNASESYWQKNIKLIESQKRDKIELAIEGSDFDAIYEDKGLYDFVPSKMMTSLGFPLPPEAVQEVDSMYGFKVKNLLLSLGIQSYVEFSKDILNTDIAVNGDMANDGKKYAGEGAMKLNDKGVYFKYKLNDIILNYIKSLDEISGKMVGDLNGEWIAAESDTDEYKDIKKGMLAALKGEGVDDGMSASEKRELKKFEDNLIKALKDNRFVGIESFKGVNIVDGKISVHYRLVFDHDKFGKFALEMFKDVLEEDSSDMGKDFADFFEKYIDIFIKKTKFTKLDVWVAVFGGSVQKVDIEQVAPSVSGVLSVLEKEVEGGRLQELIRYGFNGVAFDPAIRTGSVLEASCETGKTCESAFETPEDMMDYILEVAEKMPYTATIKIQSERKESGKKREVVSPSKYKTLEEIEKMLQVQ